MDFILLKTFSNYVEANIAQSMLEAEGVRCHLEHENTSALMGMMAGIKLMVYNTQLERAVEILKVAEEQYLNTLSCPNCHHQGFKIAYVTESHEDIVRRIPFVRWLAAISKLFSKGAMTHQAKHYICKNCSKEYEEIPG